MFLLKKFNSLWGLALIGSLFLFASCTTINNALTSKNALNYLSTDALVYGNLNVGMMRGLITESLSTDSEQVKKYESMLNRTDKIYFSIDRPGPTEKENNEKSFQIVFQGNYPYFFLKTILGSEKDLVKDGDSYVVKGMDKNQIFITPIGGSLLIVGSHKFDTVMPSKLSIDFPSDFYDHGGYIYINKQDINEVWSFTTKTQLPSLEITEAKIIIDKAEHAFKVDMMFSVNDGKDATILNFLLANIIKNIDQLFDTNETNKLLVDQIKKLNFLKS